MANRTGIKGFRSALLIGGSFGLVGVLLDADHFFYAFGWVESGRAFHYPALIFGWVIGGVVVACLGGFYVTLVLRALKTSRGRTLIALALLVVQTLFNVYIFAHILFVGKGVVIIEPRVYIVIIELILFSGITLLGIERFYSGWRLTKKKDTE